MSDIDAGTETWEKVRASTSIFPNGWSIYPKGSLKAICENVTEANADLILRLRDEAREAQQKLAAWHGAMTDVSVINWTLSKENAEDLHKQLVAVIAQTVQEQLDPTVSEQAREAQRLLTDRDEWRELCFKNIERANEVHDKLREAGLEVKRLRTSYEQEHAEAIQVHKDFEKAEREAQRLRTALESIGGLFGSAGDMNVAARMRSIARAALEASSGTRASRD